jgi:uncharacterized membrane protein YhaH (DUF805 family)
MKMEFYKKAVTTDFANFEGRATRQEYWMFFAFNFLFAFTCAFIDGLLGLGFVYLLYSLAVMVPGIAISIRRCHDIGKSGWWCLITMIPLIGAIWFIVLMATEGDNEPNAFG